MAGKVALLLLASAMLIPPAGSVVPDPLAPPAQAAWGEVPDEVILAFRGPVPEDIGAWASARSGTMLLRDDVLHWASFRFPDAARADQALADARLRADVRAAERDGYASLHLVPDDPLYGSQWGYPAIRAPAAWDLTLGSKAVKVSVLDTGLQTTHPDLAANMCGPYASFNPSEPTINDLHGHGTHVAGTIAAVSGNGLGVAGTSQSCLMGAKVLSASGSGQWSWVAAGIRWSADQGAHVISMSLGGFPAPTIVGDAVHYAYVQKGALLVASAGNSGCLGASTVGFPALYDVVMAVAALNSPGEAVGGYSSCGPKVEVAAPGTGVLSTWRNSGYATATGTSMAAPHVAGVAALLKAQGPALTHHALRCILDLTATDLGTPLKDTRSGWGRVDALRALEYQAGLEAQGLSAAFDAACLAAQVGLGWAGGVPSAPTPVPLPV